MASGVWTRGPLHATVHAAALKKNRGTRKGPECRHAHITIPDTNLAAPFRGTRQHATRMKKYSARIHRAKVNGSNAYRHFTTGSPFYHRLPPFYHRLPSFYHCLPPFYLLIVSGKGGGCIIKDRKRGGAARCMTYINSNDSSGNSRSCSNDAPHCMAQCCCAHNRTGT